MLIASLVFSLILFITSILLLYKEMLLASALTATAAYFSFRLIRENSIIIVRKWGESRGEQEEMLLFLDEELKGRNHREFFSLLEQAIKLVNKES